MCDASSTAPVPDDEALRGSRKGWQPRLGQSAFPSKARPGAMAAAQKGFAARLTHNASRSAHDADSAIYCRHHPLFIKRSYLMLLASRLPLRRVVRTGSGSNEGTGISHARVVCQQSSLSSSLLASLGADALPALVHPLGSSGRAAASARLQLCGAGKPRAACA